MSGNCCISTTASVSFSGEVFGVVKYKKHLLSSFQKTKTTQARGSVFADRIEQVKKTEFELELIKNVDCFLDGHGNYTSNLVSFKIKSL